MSRTLHLLRSEPDETVARLIDSISRNEAATVVCLYPDPISDTPVDWDRLVDDIFAHERIICWW
jgi:hypothetical protein